MEEYTGVFKEAKIPMKPEEAHVKAGVPLVEKMF